ncbi:Sec-independent protein translocase subunit TatA [Streptomyces pristinaespiralis]|jgi:sec-independent protein translocase protein TatA|uniref:Sec-independent protein translocase protein TatA n=2 Tax=Streptomyces pristinaespiralis TaxID=38300 RepID=B5H8J5_STRE2|nr:Sec-independent protein translocase subunit TatA [Streptomyces pristinaespiralis]ALC24228.1 protein translocase TatA [Streptomyces pristinaespiralis]EDY63156.1 twin arginin translocation complex component [Streptomyces pristinaespiralis ATCC 25486]QMU13394.1 Sec-independent protein translocase subunit TatA [Streptomyces pristinaespiralis]
MFRQIGPTEIIIIALLILLLFGAKKLPDMARSLGKSARILKSEAKAMKSEGQPAAAPAEPKDPAQGDTQTPHRTIQAAPGDVTSARPVSEPTDTPQR